jgi:uncharacterized phage-associated protein
MTTPQDGRAIANFVLDFCDAQGRSITNLALQKIVYFCHVWALLNTSKPLIKHKFEAWEYGPVLPYLYHEFKDFDSLAISRRATQINRATGKREVVAYNFENDMREFLTQVILFYSRMRAGDLVALSHVEGGPWHEAWNHAGKTNPGMKIEDEHIIRFYSSAPNPFPLQ